MGSGQRTRAGLLALGAIVLTAIGLLWPVLADQFASSSSAATEVTRIASYDANYVIDDQGSMQVTETIVVSFPDSPARHGIFQFFDIADSYDSGARLIPYDITATRDGQPEQVALSWEQDRYRVARLGSPDRFVTPGDHTYVIGYRVDGALSPADTPQGRYVATVGSNPGAVGSVFAWHVFAPGWLMAADKVTVNIALPSDAGVVSCAVDSAGTIPCTIGRPNSDLVTVVAYHLPASTPVTVRIDLPTPDPGRSSLPWSVSLDGVLGRSLLAVIAAGMLSILAWIGGLLWFRSSIEPAPGFPVLYEPPKGLGPEQTYFISRETSSPHALVATLFHQAERGLTRLEVQGDTWVVRGVAQPEDWYQADPVSWDLGASLGLTSVDGTFVSDGSAATGKTLNTAKKSLHSKVVSWARSQGFLRSAGTELLGRIAVIVLAVVGGLGMIFNPFHATVYWLPLPAFVIGGAGLLLRGVGTRRTAKGRQLWSRAEGFHRMLSTPSAKERFDFSARRDLYTAYIPYAVAFGCAEEWASKYRDETGTEPPVPLWIPAGYAWASADQALSSFESSISSAVAAYAATQRSSSGSGGGGFGGGGGGGGGGGSW